MNQPDTDSALLPVALGAATLDQLPASVARPQYDRSAITVGIVHFGVGAFHRSHQAMYLDRLLSLGLGPEWGICGVGLLPADRERLSQLRAQDHLYTLIEKDPQGGQELRVVGSIVDSQYAPDDPERVLDVLTQPTTRIVSLTITEGGYNIDQVTGEFDVNDPGVVADLATLGHPVTVFGYVVEALVRRRTQGIPPFVVMSCDNIQGNGTVARNAFSTFAELRDPGLASWVRETVSFPNSMVDRITPATTPQDVDQLRLQGIDDGCPVVCEPFTQWVLEDDFPLGRPEWERAGAQITQEVLPYELMKLRLLNASHQILAYAGHLAGYVYVSDAASDPVFVAFLREYMQRDARPTLMPLEGIDLDNYIETLLERFANAQLGDTIARLCAWGSDRIPKWLVPVLEQNLKDDGPIAHAATVIAGWARFCEGVDENGKGFDIVDAAAEELKAAARRYPQDPLAFLRNVRFFGNLVEDSRFVESYIHALEQFHRVGALQTLAQVK
jgi:mannitol 2-dehydrogenase